MQIIPGRGVPEKVEIPPNRKLRRFFDAYLTYTEGQEASEKYHLWTAISLIAGAMGRKVWLERGHFKIFPNLFVVIIGPPGLVKKSTATGIGAELLRSIPSVRFLPERVSDAAMIECLKNSQDKFFYKGKELQHASIYAHSSELSVLLKETHGIVTDVMINFYDCSPNNSTIPWSRETLGGGKIEIFGPCMNLLGCTTPSEIRRIIPVTQMEGGFASRILYVTDDASNLKCIPIPKYDAKTEAIKKDLIHDLAHIHGLTGEFKFSPAATKAFEDFYVKNRKLNVKYQFDGRISGYLGRKGTMIEKLAMISSAAERSDLIIDEEHIFCAVAWMQTLEKDIFEFYQKSGENENAQQLIELYKFVRERKLVTEFELYEQFMINVGLDNMKTILEQLQVAGQIQRKVSSSGVFYELRPGASPLIPELSEEAEVANCSSLGSEESPSS